MAMTEAAKIHDQLKHPVLDCDGHWQESSAVLVEYLREIGGQQLTDEFIALRRNDESWATATPEERMSKRLRRNPGAMPSDTVDKATSMLPALMRERLGELGIDFAVIYPSIGLPLSNLGDGELRRAVMRSYNKMTADAYAPHRDVFAPAACIPTHTPTEAIEEAEYAVRELGFKVIMIRGALPRPVPAYADGAFKGNFERSSRQTPFYIDAPGLDNPHDYDPFWQKCVELGVAVTGHGGSHEWADRKSVNNFVFNHIGHFAQANHVFTKGIFLGGVPRRFPKLNFAFLEGGVGYAVNLLWDLVGHWEKLTPEAMRKHLNPANTDFVKLRQLITTYGNETIKARVDTILEALPKGEVQPVDDFGAAQVNSKKELIDLYTGQFYFGCEADDPVTAWAFDPRMRARLKAVFSSDISHFDVPIMADVLPEAFEMVEKGWLTEEDFRDFTFANAAHLHGDMNTNFFNGTVLEKHASEELQPRKVAV